MTGKEFKTARTARLKYTQSELAIAMDTPKRTIQDLESLDDAQIRGVYAVCIELLIWRDAVVMQGIKEKVEIDIARQFPHGITSGQAA